MMAYDEKRNLMAEIEGKIESISKQMETCNANIEHYETLIDCEKTMIVKLDGQRELLYDWLERLNA